MAEGNNRLEAGPQALRPPHQGGRVYLDYYEFNQIPFSITPDPEFLFLSNTHRSVIDRILYGIHGRMGFILLVGEVGTGKTTICRAILDRLGGRAETVYIINPSISGNELISSILDDLGIGYPPEPSKKDLIDRLNRYLLSVSNDRPVVIVIDDAQSMPPEALEDLRLLSNLETDKAKLLQMLLVGQPELSAMIGRPEMRQLKQRVAIVCRLEYLNAEEVAGYISRRLFIAGDQGMVRFNRRALRRIREASRGIPRLINTICDYALTAAYVDNRFTVDSGHVRKALSEVDVGGRRPASGRPLRIGLAAAACGILLLLAAVMIGGTQFRAILRLPEASSEGVTEPYADVTAETVMPSPGPSLPKDAPDQDAVRLHRREAEVHDPASTHTPSEADSPSTPAPVDAGRPAGVTSNPPRVGDESAPDADPGGSNVLLAVSIQDVLGGERTAQPGPEAIQETPPALGTATRPIILLLGSYRSLETTLSGASLYEGRAFDVHWNRIDFEGQASWYRLYAGPFESKQAAKQFKTSHDLTESLIVSAPWTILIDRKDSDEKLAPVQRLLRQNHYDSHCETIDDGTHRLVSGAFVSREGAASVARKMAVWAPLATAVRR